MVMHGHDVAGSFNFSKADITEVIVKQPKRRTPGRGEKEVCNIRGELYWGSLVKNRNLHSGSTAVRGEFSRPTERIERNVNLSRLDGDRGEREVSSGE
jgi:hypothetical protein